MRLKSCGFGDSTVPKWGEPLGYMEYVEYIAYIEYIEYICLAHV